MRRRSLLAMGAAGGAAAALGAGTPAWAATSSPGLAARPRSGQQGEPDSLRALAAKIGLRFGTALVPQDIETPSYAAIAGSQFSVVTPGNGMKWQIVEPTQGSYDWSQADQLVAFARANRQLIRGHTLLWHNQLPDWLTTGVGNGTITAPQLRELLHQHIMIEVTRYRGKIWQWDVANEFFLDSDPSGIDPNNFWIAALGPDIIPQAFRWAHEADPGALLFYNDYNIAGEDGTNAKSDAVYAWLQEQLAAGVPIMGIGNQGHLDTQYGFSGARFQQDLERYASAGREGGDHRGRRPHVREQRDRPGADGQPGRVRAAVRVLADAQGRPGRARASSRSPSGASPTPTPGCLDSSRARATRRSTT